MLITWQKLKCNKPHFNQSKYIPCIKEYDMILKNIIWLNNYNLKSYEKKEATYQAHRLQVYKVENIQVRLVHLTRDIYNVVHMRYSFPVLFISNGQKWKF